jgi:hypothetical protein
VEGGEISMLASASATAGKHKADDTTQGARIANLNLSIQGKQKVECATVSRLGATNNF